MRARLTSSLPPVLLVTLGSFASALAIVACSDDAPPPAASEDAGGGAAPRRDGGEVDPEEPSDAGRDTGEPEGPVATEKEPNNGATEAEIDALTIPGAVKGAIDPADDIDVFAVSPAPGELWEWSLTPAADLAPHLTIFDTAPGSKNPTVLVKGEPKAAVTLEHFVLGTGKLVAAVRDARNVPTATGAGGPGHGYTLRAKKKTPAPVAVTFPSTKTGKLASLSSVQLYSFKTTTATGLDVIVRADRKTPSSTLDSRLSIFSVTAKSSIGTNDDAAGTSDSQLGGTLPAGDYIVVLENEGTNATDLSYEIEFALR